MFEFEVKTSRHLWYNLYCNKVNEMGEGQNYNVCPYFVQMTSSETLYFV